MSVRMVRWVKYEGEGTPDMEWRMSPDSSGKDVMAIKIEDNTYDDNSEEAITIKKQLKSVNFRLTNIKCEKCGHLMEKYLLRYHPKTNRLGWKSRIICSNEECLEEYYTKEDI